MTEEVVDVRRWPCLQLIKHRSSSTKTGNQLRTVFCLRNAAEGCRVIDAVGEARVKNGQDTHLSARCHVAKRLAIPTCQLDSMSQPPDGIRIRRLLSAERRAQNRPREDKSIG